MKKIFDYIVLACCYVEASLLHLITDVATSLLAYVAKYFGEHPLQRVVGYRTIDMGITIVGDVKRSAKPVATFRTCISITLLQIAHIFLTTQDAGDDDAMQGYSFHEKGIEV